MTTPILYNNNDLASDTIDTVILSGGGYLGILYFGLIKLLDTENMYHGIKRVYGVSVGSIFALLIILKYSYDDAIRLLETEFDVSKFITINTKDIFNLAETFGLSEPTYIEQSVKTILEKAGMSPYVTMDDLYNHTGIEFNLGVTLALQNKYVLINHITRPDLPVWLAIRMSANLPIIFNPVRDRVFNDLVYDGGHLNNNPIKHYLDSAYTYKKPAVCDACTQTEEINVPNDCETETVVLRPCNKPSLKKYRMNFICIDLKMNRMQSVLGDRDLDAVSLMDYLTAIISKFTYNQDSYKAEYKPYMLSIDCTQFPELAQIPITVSNQKIKEICDQGFCIINEYYRGLMNNAVDDITK